MLTVVVTTETGETQEREVNEGAKLSDLGLPAGFAVVLNDENTTRMSTELRDGDEVVIQAISTKAGK